MQIKLLTGFMWFLPDTTKIHLTEENPGPIEIDKNNLSPEDKKLISIGVQLGQIYCSESLVEKPVEPIKIDNDINLKSKLDIILNKKIPTIKREVGFLNSPRELRMLFDIEKGSKNREKVLSLIDEKLTAINQFVSRSIKDNDVKLPPDPDKEILNDIIESDIEPVTIPIE